MGKQNSPEGNVSELAYQVLVNNFSFFATAIHQQKRFKATFELYDLMERLEDYSKQLTELLEQHDVLEQWLNGNFKAALKYPLICYFLITHQNTHIVALWARKRSIEQSGMVKYLVDFRDNIDNLRAEKKEKQANLLHGVFTKLHESLHDHISGKIDLKAFNLTCLDTLNDSVLALPKELQKSLAFFSDFFLQSLNTFNRMQVAHENNCIRINSKAKTLLKSTCRPNENDINPASPS